MKPDIPPYFKGDFFPAIRRIHATPLNVANTNLKAIYRFLIEEVTMSEEDTGTGVLKLIPLRVETGQPANNWEMVWEMARQSKLEPALATFLFKLLHQILPTAERVSRILPNQSPLCTRCKCNPQAVETLEHAMFECSENNGVSTVLLNGLKTILPDLTPNKVLSLNFLPPEDLNFFFVWSIAYFLSSMWQLRTDKKKVDLIKIRTDMEASIRLLRESRLYQSTAILNLIF